MQFIFPSFDNRLCCRGHMSTDLQELQNRLWGVADELRANSGLKASEYASPVLGLIFSDTLMTVLTVLPSK